MFNKSDRKIVLITAAISMWFIMLCGFVIDENKQKAIEAPHPELVTLEESTEDETVYIPVITFSKEEADEHISQLQEARKPKQKTQKQNNTGSKTSSNQNESNAYYLAAAICREAGGSSTEIMMLVGNVIMNRVESSYFPNTIYGVLTQKYQYGMMWRDGVSFPSWADGSAKERCYSVANRLLSGERVCPSNVVFQAEFVQGSGIYAQYPGFYFCYM